MPDPRPAQSSQPDDLGITARYARSARSGKTEDLERLYAHTAPVLYVWLRGRIGRSLRLEVDVEDVMQEIWTRALAGFQSFDPERGSVRSWLLGIARMILLESMRKASARAATKSGDVSSSQLLRCPDSVTSITKAVARDEGVRRFLAHLDALDEDDRTLLIGHGVEGESLTELATRMGLRADALRKRWQRLVERLRDEGIGREILAERWD